MLACARAQLGFGTGKHHNPLSSIAPRALQGIASMDSRQTFILAIGGATGSGKTTLAKHLGRIIPSLLVFQDDFAPAEDQVPIDPRYGWQDWDAKDGAIDWAKQRRVFDTIRETGVVPEEHSSHDHLNEQVPVEIQDETEQRWKDKFARLSERCGEAYP